MRWAEHAACMAAITPKPKDKSPLYKTYMHLGKEGLDRPSRLQDF